MNEASKNIEKMQKTPDITIFEDLVDSHAEQMDLQNEISDFFTDFSESQFADVEDDLSELLQEVNCEDNGQEYVKPEKPPTKITTKTVVKQKAVVKA